MIEVWKGIKGYSYYEVSNIGRVRSLPRVHASKAGSFALKGGRILKPATVKGYLKLTLTDDNSYKKMFFVHRIVASAFIGNMNDKPFINHIDGNKSNNCVDNLEWCTTKENSEHAIRTGLYNGVGENNPNAKLDKFDFIHISQLIRQGAFKRKDIAMGFGITRTHLWAIAKKYTT